MSKRAERRKAGASFLQDTTKSSLEDVVAEGYGLNLATSQRIVAKGISIHAISPDPKQPRRVVPQGWQEHAGVSYDDPLALLTALNDATPSVDLDLILGKAGTELDEEHFDGFDGNDGDIADLRVAEAFRQVAELAASINRDGLTNPITVVQEGDGYQIETGERRWLAYHLLSAYFGDEDWSEIPARIVDAFDVWRQATENTARDDLNAVGRARQFSLLMMDLWEKHEQPKTFTPMSEFAHEREFYAQIGDMRPPRGKAGDLMTALGVGSSAAFTRARKILSLPNLVWTAGDDLALPEDTLLRLAEMERETAMAEMEKLFDSKGFSEETNQNQTQASESQAQIPEWERDLKRFRKRVTPAKWKKLPDEDRATLLGELKALVKTLEKLEKGSG